MKCPQCGKEMSLNDTLIPISDKEGNIIDCFHVPSQIWELFVSKCVAENVNPGEKLEEFMKDFLESMRKKESS